MHRLNIMNNNDNHSRRLGANHVVHCAVPFKCNLHFSHSNALLRKFYLDFYFMDGNMFNWQWTFRILWFSLGSWILEGCDLQWVISHEQTVVSRAPVLRVHFLLGTVLWPRVLQSGPYAEPQWGEGVCLMAVCCRDQSLVNAKYSYFTHQIFIVHLTLHPARF